MLMSLHLEDLFQMEFYSSGIFFHENVEENIERTKAPWLAPVLYDRDGEDRHKMCCTCWEVQAVFKRGGQEGTVQPMVSQQTHGAGWF